MQLKEEAQKPQDAAGSFTDYQRPVSGGLPLTFYIRSARLCLKKATLARLQERGSGEDELQHLRRFESLVACALPAHREYSERRGEKAVKELHVGLVEARRRIQELLQAGTGVSPAKVAAAGSGSSAGCSRKTGSPRKPAVSPSVSVLRTGSRTRSIQGDKKVVRPTKSPVLRQGNGLRKIQTTPKRSESPTKKVGSPPRYQRSTFESRKQLSSGSESRQKSSEDKSSAYYLPKKLPASLQKNRKAVNRIESRFETPSRSSGLRDSTRSLPTEKRNRHEDGAVRLRRSYDDLPSYEDLREFYNEKYEPLTQSSAKNSAWRRDNTGTTGKAEKVWDNLVYDRGRRATPSVSSNATDRFTTPEGRASLYSDSGVKSLVRELKSSFDAFSMRFEEEGKKWRDRVGVVEKEIEFFRDETEGDLVVIRRTIQEEAKKKENSIKKLCATLDDGFIKEIESLRVEISRKGDRSWVESFVKDTVLEFLENNRADEVHTLRAEVVSLSKGREELQSNLEHLFQMMENDRETVTTEQAGMTTENGYIRKQLQSVKKEEMEIRSDLEDMKRGFAANIVELGRSIEKLKEETVEIRIHLKGLEDAMKAERTASRRSDRTRDESTSNAQEKMMIMDRVENLSKLYLGGLDEVRMDILNIKNKCQDKLEELEDQLRDFKQRQENLPSFMPSQTIRGYDELNNRVASLEAKQEKMHVAALEEVRTTMSNLDTRYQCRLEEIEDELRNLKRQNNAAAMRLSSKSVVGELETRLSELEKKQEELQMNWDLLDDAVSTAGKERQTAASAAADAADAATKATEILEEILKYSDPEMKTKLDRTVELHDSLVLGKEAFSAAASEMRRVNDEISRGTDSALNAAFEAKRKAEDLQEELKSLIDQVNKQKAASPQAAAKAASLATESEAEMSVMQRKVQLEAEADEIGSKKTVNKKQLSELEKRVEALEKTKSEKSWNVSTKATRGSFTGVRKKLASEDNSLSKMDPRLGNLENHLEHVASATYTNLRILDRKVEHVSVTAQSALEGASLAESKCGALGSELVKVFRVLASFKREEKQSCRFKDSCSSSSPGKRPLSGKKAGSVSSLSLDGESSGGKRINVRLGAAGAEKHKEQVAEQSKNRDKRRVKNSIQEYEYVRRSWAPTEMTRLAEQDDEDKDDDDNDDDDDEVETESKERTAFKELRSWGIMSRGISVMREDDSTSSAGKHQKSNKC